MALRPRLPIDYAPLADQVSARMTSPPAMAAPEMPQDSERSAALRELLLEAAQEFAKYQPAYSAEAPIEVFLSQSAATGAVFRLRSVAELLRDGTCGLVAAAMARSLLEDAAAWGWASENPDRIASMADYLSGEWHGLVKRSTKLGLPTAPLERWLAPPAWRGGLSSSSTAPPFPGADAAVGALSRPLPPDSGLHPAMPIRLPAIATMASLLANCGHFNSYAALSCPFNWDLGAAVSDEGSLGGRLTPELEAVVAHIAAASTLTICVVNAWSDAEPLPGAEQALMDAAALAFAVDELAASIHGLGGVDDADATSLSSLNKKRKRPTASRRPAPPIEEPSSRWEPHPNDTVEAVRATAIEFFDLATRDGPQILPIPPVSRARYVTLPTLMSTAWATRTLAHDINTTVVAAHAARQLLEAGARWRWALDGDADRIMERAETLLSEVSVWRDKIAAIAHNDNVAAGVDWFVTPSGFDVDDLVSHRRPAPSPSLKEVWASAAVPHMGLGGRWLELAYSLLSQSTHHTPIGALHGVTPGAGTDLVSGAASPQLEALAIDAGVWGAYWLWTGLAPFMLGVPTSRGQQFDPVHMAAWRRQMRECALRVHRVAFPLHGLFDPAVVNTVGRNDRCPCRSGRKFKRCHGV